MQNNSACAITVEVRTPDNCDFCLVGMICHSLEISLLGLSKYIPRKPTFVELIFGKSPTYQGLCLKENFSRFFFFVKNAYIYTKIHENKLIFRKVDEKPSYLM